jgi:hypothetical protein
MSQQLPTPQEAKKLREVERRKLHNKEYKMKEFKKKWKSTNSATFIDIDAIDYLLNNNMDIMGLKAWKKYRKDEKE